MRGQRRYGDHHLSIYQAGLKGQRPRLPMGMEELEATAKALLPLESYWYVAGGEEGVREVVARVLADIDLTMALAGVARFADINHRLLAD